MEGVPGKGEMTTHRQRGTGKKGGGGGWSVVEKENTNVGDFVIAKPFVTSQINTLPAYQPARLTVHFRPFFHLLNSTGGEKR